METLAQYLEAYIEHEKTEHGNIVVDADMLRDGINAYQSVYNIVIHIKER